MVVDRQKRAEFMCALADAQHDPAGKELATRLGTHQPRGVRIDWSGVLQTLAATVRASLAALLEADAAHQRELSDDEEPRTARDEAAHALYDALVAFRDGVTAVYGAPFARQLGFSGTTPADPTALEQLAGQVLGKLDTVRTPRPLVPGGKVDLEAASESLVGPLAQVRRALKDIARETREAQATLVRKNQAMERFDADLRAFALVLEGLLIMAGMTDLAERVRPATASRGTTGEETPSDDNPTPSPAPKP
jgi:hypothetical protein